jgi:ribosomal 50S subunit-associated protein YjgA (DUF615 family)
MSQHATNERRARYEALLMRRLTLAAAQNALHAARNTCDASDGAVYRLREMTERCVDEANVTEEAIQNISDLMARLDG